MVIDYLLDVMHGKNTNQNFGAFILKHWDTNGNRFYLTAYLVPEPPYYFHHNNALGVVVTVLENEQEITNTLKIKSIVHFTIKVTPLS